MSRLVLIAVVLLAGCATPPATAFRVEWTDDVASSCGNEVIGRVAGCAKREGEVCVIYAQRPKSEKDTKRFVTLGHEMMHCAEGQWHDKYGEMVKQL